MTFVGIQMEKDLKELLQNVAKARGEAVSSFIRRSIKKELARLGYLPDAEKKALGVVGPD